MLTQYTGFVGICWTRYKQTQVSFDRLRQIIPATPSGALVEHRPVTLRGRLPALDAPARGPADRLVALNLSGLMFCYPGTGRGIRAVDLHIRPGTITVITGRVGAGKTTLLRVLLGLLPGSGEIRWNGQTVARLAVFFVPPRVAYTPQGPRLFSESLRDNILQGLPVSESQLQCVLHTAVLDADLAALEHGLATLVGSGGARFSGGQVQRTAAARMLVREPELPVCDDLSSVLDVETERLLWQRLIGQGQRTCLVVSHRRSLLQLADQMLVLKDGAVAGVGGGAAAGDLRGAAPAVEQRPCAGGIAASG